ncbi:methyltransferase [Acidiferrimicrobium sp. IK]|uniref:class I SAM-dependent methyltransferase n=1 Tax=Acidiferrimicrobium sp. IK TaxID=2871700 RepID=UPI0021CAF345|nr:class I SAM-dependent methyltransferase [Acidiferrimicrobium sp. IK]MCU4184794.1 methyltransferase [Acidiferrimicrobium sp. IK]
MSSGPPGAAGHYFQAEPSAPSRPATVHLHLPDVDVELGVDRGVFSAGRVDPGTMHLLRVLPPLPGGDILDLGCGYGPIACTLARRSPDATVWAVDVNQRALALTAANAASLGLGNVRAVAPDDVPGGLRFSAMVSNPPIKVGKLALHEMLQRWLPRVAPGGEAWMVVHRHLGADSLAAWLTSGGRAVERRGSKQGYRLLRVTAAPAATPPAPGPAGGDGPGSAG